MQTKLIESNPLLLKSVEFALALIEYCERLDADKKFVISNQLLRYGTAIGANSMEAQNAESKRDFLHKLKIAAKEADETQYWLMLCSRSTNYPNCEHLISKIDELTKILMKIISTVKRKIDLELRNNI